MFIRQNPWFPIIQPTLQMVRFIYQAGLPKQNSKVKSNRVVSMHFLSIIGNQGIASLIATYIYLNYSLNCDDQLNVLKA